MLFLILFSNYPPLILLGFRLGCVITHLAAGFVHPVRQPIKKPTGLCHMADFKKGTDGENVRIKLVGCSTSLPHVWRVLYPLALGTLA